jgi:hypothetical protein
MVERSKTHHLQLCYAHAVTNYRRNFICGGSFFFTANLAERRLRLPVDDISSAKDDGFRCRLTHPTGYVLQEPVERRIGQRGNHFQFAPPLDLQMDQSAFPAASRLRPRGGGLRRSLSSARAQICSTHIPRIAGVALTRRRLRR